MARRHDQPSLDLENDKVFQRQLPRDIVRPTSSQRPVSSQRPWRPRL